MRYECPKYAKLFRCTADKCSDNCCIGWEIGIDALTREKYEALGGAIGDKIRKNLNTGDTYATFKLCKSGRCPMLGDDNLCEIIKCHGENFISEICKEHPRYYTYLSDRVEWGVGLACEEAARLILSTDDSETVTEERPIKDSPDTEEDDEELVAFLSFARGELYGLMESSAYSVSERLCSALYYAEALQEAIDARNFSAVYPFMPLKEGEKLDTGTTFKKGELYSEIIFSLQSLDFLDSNFKDELCRLAKKISATGVKVPSAEGDKQLIKLFKYFIHRYLLDARYDEDVISKIKLAVILPLTILALTDGSDDLSTWIRAAKALSKEVEYNEDNLALVLEMTFTEAHFSTQSLLRLF